MSISEVIRRRRSVFPNQYKQQPISEAAIWQILENANWAPNHRKTEPWRFRVFTGAGLQQLSDYMGDFFRREQGGEIDPGDLRYRKAIEKPLQSAAAIAIILHRDPEGRLPHWEEVAAVSCAVQNMWLTCTELGIGSYWSTPKVMLQANDFLQLEDGEECLGIFYLGHWDPSELPARRGDIREKVRWVK